MPRSGVDDRTCSVGRAGDHDREHVDVVVESARSFRLGGFHITSLDFLTPSPFLFMLAPSLTWSAIP